MTWITVIQARSDEVSDQTRTLSVRRRGQIWKVFRKQNHCGSDSKEYTCQCRRHKRRGFNPWVRKILLRMKGLLVPVRLRSLVSYSS